MHFIPSDRDDYKTIKARRILDTIARTGTGTVVCHPESGEIFISRYLWNKARFAILASPDDWCHCDSELAEEPNGVRYVFGNLPATKGGYIEKGRAAE